MRSRRLADQCGSPLPRCGNCTGSTSGVPSVAASHGNDAANASAANGQSCLPGWVTTAQLIPLAPAMVHKALAAASWPSGLAALVLPRLGLAACATLCAPGGVGMSNHPDNPV